MAQAELELSPPTLESKPRFLRVRASVPFVVATAFVGAFADAAAICASLMDLRRRPPFTALIIPIAPFQLERWGYSSSSTASLTGWLILGSSAGGLAGALGVAAFADRSATRKAPLVACTVFLLAGMILAIVARNLAALVASRVMSGLSGATVYSLYMSLITETTNSRRRGLFIGVIFMGQKLGALVGPPISGALFDRFGFRAPYIFGASGSA